MHHHKYMYSLLEKLGETGKLFGDTLLVLFGGVLHDNNKSNNLSGYASREKTVG